MKNKKILLVRPPRYLWPVINESDNFLLPLGLPCLAAAVRKELSDMEVKIIDCPPLKIGWKTLARMLSEEKPDYVGAGEEALYHHEALRLFELAKDLNPKTITIGGGHFFSWMTEHTLKNYPTDYIVRFEGEETLVELLKTLNNNGDLSKVAGISYRNNGSVINNPLRQLCSNLDDFPIAAYDLMPMGKYSPFGYLWPISATIEHSRGCIDKCSFCSLWTFWGKNTQNNNRTETNAPCYRTKSVQRTIEEVEILYKKYNRRYLIWADPTWNVDPRWTDQFCEELLKREFKDLYWWAFLRADYIVRDEKLGIMEKMVRAGLVHPLIGIERAQDKDLRDLEKSVYSRDITLQAYDILKKKYPHVFRQGTILTCLRTDSKESMLDLVDYAIKLGVDYPAFHPLAPVPGTKYYNEAKYKGWLEINDFKQYDWYTPIMSSATLTREKLAKLNMELNKRFIIYRPHWTFKGLFSKGRHRRGLYWWFLRVTIKMIFLGFIDHLLGGGKMEGVTAFMRLKKPKWYDN